MIDLIENYKIPVCGVVSGQKLSPSFLSDTKDKEDIEGYVIRFNSGAMVKIKCTWYLTLHRIKSEIEFERGVVALILSNNMDDLKPLMPEEDLHEIEDYESAFWNSFSISVEKIETHILNIEKNSITRKEFALGACTIEGYEKQIVFKLWNDGFEEAGRENISELLTEIILRNCSKNVKFNEFRKNTFFESIPPWRGVSIDA